MISQVGRQTSCCCNSSTKHDGNCHPLSALLSEIHQILVLRVSPNKREPWRRACGFHGQSLSARAASTNLGASKKVSGVAVQGHQRCTLHVHEDLGSNRRAAPYSHVILSKSLISVSSSVRWGKR